MCIFKNSCSGVYLCARTGEEEDGVARLLQADQRGTVRVEAAEDNLPIACLIKDHLRQSTAYQTMPYS